MSTKYYVKGPDGYWSSGGMVSSREHATPCDRRTAEIQAAYLQETGEGPYELEPITS